jgi:hypothetical protein
VSKKNGRSPKLLAIDLALLEILPDEGQMLGFTPIALPVSAIREREEFQYESGVQIGGRLRSMEFNGLTSSQVVLPTQRGLGWQRTAAGRAALRSATKGAVTA